MTFEEVVENHLPAIAQQARICHSKLPSNSILEVDDLVQDGVVFVAEELLHTFEEEGRGKFITYLTFCIRNYYANRLKAEYNRTNASYRLAGQAKVNRVPVLGSSISGPRECAVFNELRESFSDGLKEILAMLLEPSEALLLRMRLAKNRGGGAVLGQLRKISRSKGVEWEALCQEVVARLHEHGL